VHDGLEACEHRAMIPEVVETARLRLRPPRLEDAEAMFTTWARDPEVARYLTWRPHASIEDTRAFLRSAQWAEQEGHRPWIIERRDDGRVLGMIGLTLEAKNAIGGALAPHRASVGYGLGRAYWGQGIMTEALREVIAVTLAVPSMYRVYAYCDVENLASARVMEKAGMSFEGVLRRWGVHPNRSSEPRDCRCYAAVR